MPCPLCEAIYQYKPCTTSKVELDDFLKTQVSLINMNYTETYNMDFYRELSKECPCKECLVKVVCFKDRFNCSDYAEFTRKISPYYLHKKGKYNAKK